MEADQNPYAQMNNEGYLKIPSEVALRYGIKAGINIPINENTSSIQLCQPARLAKLYIEPTNECNLDCRTCIRKVWKESQGMMSAKVFTRIIEDLKVFSPPPTIFFGGFGEPLLHPDIIEMVTSAKALGVYVELITNGTLLTANLSKELIKAGIDMLWVSLDGATTESFADIRIGASLQQVIDNIMAFHNILNTEGRIEDCCVWKPGYDAQLGIEFVAMKRNIADLPAVINLGRKAGVSKIIISNVLPYTEDMKDEMLYHQTVNANLPRISIPGTGGNEIIRDLLLKTGLDSNLMSPDQDVIKNGRCPFIESGAGAINWDGSLSPCLPHLHSYSSFGMGYECFSRRWVIGNIMEQSLYELWNKPEHIAFRQRVKAFDFPGCTLCGGCDLSVTNETDCYGNEFPTCGNCLWAQGLIQCP